VNILDKLRRRVLYKVVKRGICFVHYVLKLLLQYPIK
jgi:hypothetical protein